MYVANYATYVICKFHKCAFSSSNQQCGPYKFPGDNNDFPDITASQESLINFVAEH